ncbi:MAG: DUF1704 domain-containing protein [Polyangiaceae bacterium]|nr:DUF1704 domain-containing protein [Polyangiaceae bacterium]
MATQWDRFDRAIIEAERRIALLDRSQPKNAQEELRQTVAHWSRGQPRVPIWSYAALPDGESLREALGAIACELEGPGTLAGLYRARVRELMLEAELAAAVGGSSFLSLAQSRYRLPASDAAPANQLAKLWSADRFSPSSPLIDCDDGLDPRSLLSRFRAACHQFKLPLRVEIRRGLPSIAAIGDGVVMIREGHQLTNRHRDRLILHEIAAHILPRIAAESAPLGILRVGTAGASQGEEGRAVFIEERASWLDADRRWELAVRHQAATSVLKGADFVAVVRDLIESGATVTEGVGIATRCFRGGGLAREVIYLRGFLEVRDAFALAPELERWFEAGRVSIEGARQLNTFENGSPLPPDAPGVSWQQVLDWCRGGSCSGD